MTVDIDKARENARQLQGHAEFRVRLAANTIAALLDEVDRLTRTPAHEREDMRCVISDLCDQVEEARAERDALAREVDACSAALPGPYYMDPPDGGDVPISEQLRRMARDAARYRFIRRFDRFAHVDSLLNTTYYNSVDAAVDEVMKGAGDE